MYGDSDVMRRRTDQLREQAVDLRALADQLVAQTEGIGWHGRAADSMRERVRERASHLRAAAAQHDTAADSLGRHVQEIDTVKDAIADKERKATTLVADARTRVARIEAANDDEPDPAVRRVPDADDQTLAGFIPPPSGHKDWLAVSLPGL
jgi:chromosome segregation ATPase